jgi:ATP-dependent Clp protease protease subunit
MECVIELRSPLVEWDTTLDADDLCVYVGSHITDELATWFCKRLCALERRGVAIIPIILQCQGGEVDALLVMLSAMEACRAHLLTFVAGSASSAAACLFAMGSEGMRYMSPFAQLMFHETSSVWQGQLSEVERDYAHSKTVDNLINHRIEKHCGLSEGFFRRLALTSKDSYMPARRALEVGIATNVGTPRVSVQVVAHFDLDGKVVRNPNNVKYNRTVLTAPPDPVYREVSESVETESQEELDSPTKKRKRSAELLRSQKRDRRMPRW